LKHLVYDGPVDIHVAVNQRVADNIRPDHAESFLSKGDSYPSHALWAAIR
jgi:hypothetical protein